ncbi:hypothetical protein [Chitinophaga pinensis]|uniref:MoxR-vWA-beta-propeller ternary system domain-containing protein n=1 Tax=Chitinophaga pinensis TaxID=79329 RepID=A0A5C6LN92_9BACT|nr:hypothetical protein [Chitinophaga pinensis]TWV98035.1 hypothetical protein FEF09_20925 [Chitinophaga pinensis]
MKEMIIVLPLTQLETLGNIRTWPDLQVALSGDDIWVRGIPAESTDIRLRKLPVKHTYLADFEGRLFLPGRQTPHDTLKRMTWEALTSFLTVELPVSALPGKTRQTFTIQLTPAPQTTEPAAVITNLAHWKAYADNAPLIRLQQLSFAVCESEEVLVIGAPVPSLPGKAYVVRNNLLLPAGYDFDPSMAGAFIIEQFAADKDAMILFHPDGQWERIPMNCFVMATRSAIRLTNVL